VKERQIEVEPRIKRPLANASVRFFCFSFLEKMKLASCPSPANAQRHISVGANRREAVSLPIEIETYQGGSHHV